MLADVIVVVHLVFVLFATFGGLLAFRWRWIPWIHLPALAWATFVELTGTVCPLTPLENELRAAAHDATYEGDFVSQYLLPIIYPAGLTPAIQTSIGFGLLVLNAVIYAAVWRSTARR